MSSGYAERLELIRRTIALETVDRVPSIFMGTAFAPRYMGGSIGRYCNDMEYCFEVQLDALDRLGYIDGVNLSTGGRIGPILSALWLSRVAVPGVELPDDTLWQVMEAEVMTLADYDVILEKGWKPFVHDYLPRVVDMRLLGDTFAWMGQNDARIKRTYIERGYVVITDAIMAPTRGEGPELAFCVHEVPSNSHVSPMYSDRLENCPVAPPNRTIRCRTGSYAIAA